MRRPVVILIRVLVGERVRAVVLLHRLKGAGAPRLAGPSLLSLPVQETGWPSDSSPGHGHWTPTEPFDLGVAHAPGASRPRAPRSSSRDPLAPIWFAPVRADTLGELADDSRMSSRAASDLAGRSPCGPRWTRRSLLLDRALGLATSTAVPRQHHVGRPWRYRQENDVLDPQAHAGPLASGGCGAWSASEFIGFFTDERSRRSAASGHRFEHLRQVPALSAGCIGTAFLRPYRSRAHGRLDVLEAGQLVSGMAPMSRRPGTLFWPAHRTESLSRTST